MDILVLRVAEAPNLIALDSRAGEIAHCVVVDGSSGQLQNLLLDRDFQGLKIQILHRLAPQQSLNLLKDVHGQQIGDEVFF